jgi:hypothetical protein
MTDSNVIKLSQAAFTPSPTSASGDEISLATTDSFYFRTDPHGGTMRRCRTDPRAIATVLAVWLAAVGPAARRPSSTTSATTS